jgi:hypothetical protein
MTEKKLVILVLGILFLLATPVFADPSPAPQWQKMNLPSATSAWVEGYTMEIGDYSCSINRSKGRIQIIAKTKNGSIEQMTTIMLEGKTFEKSDAIKTDKGIQFVLTRNDDIFKRIFLGYPNQFSSEMLSGLEIYLNPGTRK